MTTAFQAAVEQRDSDAVTASLAEDVTFHAPLQHTPFEGRDLVGAILTIPARVFAFSDTFRYTRAITDDHWHALFFVAELPNGKQLEGVDLVHVDDFGLVDELRVMMRPVAQLNEFLAYAEPLIAEMLQVDG